jgi:hypothetical protein
MPIFLISAISFLWSASPRAVGGLYISDGAGTDGRREQG